MSPPFFFFFTSVWTTTTARERVFVNKFSITRIHNAVLGDKHGTLMHVYGLESHQLKWKYLSATFWVRFLFFGGG